MVTYETGTLLWGSNKSTGNVWIVTDGPARAIAKVYDGAFKLFMNTLAIAAKDTIKPTSFLYELTPMEYITLTNMAGAIPQWATDLMKLRPALPPKLNTPFALLSRVPPHSIAPSVVEKVEKALGVCLTDTPKPVTVYKDESRCPIGGGEHRYVPYTGLNHSFEFCVKCDSKRGVSKP